MKLVRLVDFGITHAIMCPGETWCGRAFPENAYVVGSDQSVLDFRSDEDNPRALPDCKSCLRCLAGPLGPGKGIPTQGPRLYRTVAEERQLREAKERYGLKDSTG